MEFASTIDAARAAATSVSRQALSPELRRAMLSSARPGTAVQVVDKAKLSRFTVLALVEPGPTYCLEDAYRGPEGWVGRSARFNADGFEVDASGVVLSTSRVLVVPALSAQEAAGVLADWTERMESHCNALRAASPSLDMLFLAENEDVELFAPPCEPLTEDVGATMEAYASAMAQHRSGALGLSPDATFAHAKAVLANLHDTPRDMAATLAMLSPAELEAVAEAARLMQRAVGARRADFMRTDSTHTRATHLSRGWGNHRPA